MAQESFYVDTCIWLNLFKKEDNPAKGVPYWKIAKDFIEMAIFSEEKQIYYSGLILKELKFNLDSNLFKERLAYLQKEKKFKFLEVSNEDYIFARKLESKSGYNISFYDCLHIAICKRMDLILVTRDKNLIRFAKNFILAEKPENLFC